MSNRLINETSPYLLQHAHNPVEWYPWGNDALTRAREENKPIFLSIGYAACHWCHVMAHESFENGATAEIMNRYFVNIKVDREERPDLDSIYMQATVGMTGHGGWPMSVFLTPEGVPFYTGTYFPPAPRQGMPSFQQVLASLAEAWANQQDKIISTTDSLKAFYQSESRLLSETTDAITAQIANAAARNAVGSVDRLHGGWGSAPKFPQPMTLEFLLANYVRTKDESALRACELTLTKMAYGGIYDQLGGGFHRYATDAIWLVPHFEKMLYDNSQLARVYLHAWQVTGNPLYIRIVEETLDYVVREMTHADGGFFSTQDADSDGEEGKFFVWTADELRQLLGDEVVLFNDVYGVSRSGNFEGANILHAARNTGHVAKEHTLNIERLDEILAQARRKLWVARELRVKPARDEKVLTAWNGLMLAAFAEAARALDRQDYLTIAERNADFLLLHLRSDSGRLLRSWKDGSGAKLNGYLEDYTHLIEGLLAVYQTSFSEKYFVAARELADTMLDHFLAPDGLFYDTSDDHEALVTRPRDLQDNAVPSGNAMAATVLLKLGAYTGEARYTDIAIAALQRVQDSFEKYPTAFGQWLLAYELAIAPIKEVALVSAGTMSELQQFLRVLRRAYAPNLVVAAKQSDDATSVPLLAGRTALQGRATAFVCRDFVCQLPVTTPDAMERQLR